MKEDNKPVIRWHASAPTACGRGRWLLELAYR